jgi:ppGpp synthetase/RelA/SpoT-type nucleotidyltranferase
MDGENPAEIQQWLRDQVEDYGELFPRFKRYAELLHEVLQAAAKRYAPLAIVQTRPKAIASFSGKALLKRQKYSCPVHEFTDLCGGRIIARTRSEVIALCDFIERTFDIDWENSLDARKRLLPSEFGYRSIHYIVSPKLDGDELGLEVPDELHGFHCRCSDVLHPFKAEVQVRTTVEHAWADFAHDLSYKGAFELPTEWKREVAVIAAELENVDHAFDRVERGLRAYAANYGSYLSEAQIAERIAQLEMVLDLDPRNVSLGWQIGKLAITLGNWQKAVDVLDGFVDADDPAAAYQPALRDLGMAICKLHAADPGAGEYRRGQRYLELAAAPPNKDPDALSSLAGTWRGIDDEKASELYRQAFELDPTDFYPLGNYLEYEVGVRGNRRILDVVTPLADRALARCQAQVAVGVNLPWALYGMAKLQLLMGRPTDALASYAKAVQTSTAPFMIIGALTSLDMLAEAADRLPGHGWATRLLTAALAVKFPSEAASQRLAAYATATDLRGPAVLVVGATDPRLDEEMQRYRALLAEAFRDFTGTIVSGGTRQGISGLVGEVAAAHPQQITTIAYLPSDLPEDATEDDRYTHLHRTDGETFTPLEPLQGWIDLIASGVDAQDVKVLGVNGGGIAAIEYRIALALGATTAVLEDSGRAAAQLLGDEQWATSEHLVAMAADPQTVRAFVGSGSPRLEPEIRERMARAAHGAFVSQRAREETVDDPSLQEWDRLPDSLQDSNRQQADHIAAKLRQIGCTAVTAGDHSPVLFEFSSDEIETLAEMEHGRWCWERKSSGWVWGESKDAEKKISPYLVSWRRLPEEIKERDRQVVRAIPELLATEGLEIRRL